MVHLTTSIEKLYMLWSSITKMQHYCITLTALIRGNIILIKIVNTKAFLSLVALCQGDAVLPSGWVAWIYSN
jgi:hypothetical protein